MVGRKAKIITVKKTIEGETTKETTKKVNRSPAKFSNAMTATVGGETKSKKPRRRVPPRTAAIVLTCPAGQYAETMAEVRAKIKLSEVGIQNGITTRTAATGALLIEVPRSENGPKADAPWPHVCARLKDKEGVRVNRPTKMAEIRVRGLECSIRKEVMEAVAEKETCRSYEIQAGDIRRTSENQGSLWLKLPLAAAKKAVEGGTLQVGWSRVKITLLEARPLRCYKCLERWHVREKCPNSQNRSNRCYRCGGLEDTAKECTALPKCPICVDQGRKADNTLGSQQCTTQRRRGKVGETGQQKITPSLPVEGAQTRITRDNEKEEQPKPQRLPRNRIGRSQDAPSTLGRKKRWRRNPWRRGEERESDVSLPTSGKCRTCPSGPGPLTANYCRMWLHTGYRGGTKPRPRKTPVLGGRRVGLSSHHMAVVARCASMHATRKRTPLCCRPLGICSGDKYLSPTFWHPRKFRNMARRSGGMH